MHSFCHATNFAFCSAVRLRLAKLMQLAFSFDTCVPLAPQHDFPPEKDEIAANTPATNNAKVVLIMHLRQHELTNVQTGRARNGHPERSRGIPWKLSLRFRGGILRLRSG